MRSHSSRLAAVVRHGLVFVALVALAGALPARAFDSDGDGVQDGVDNCRFAANAGQQDGGGVGSGSPPNGVGNACECGDVNGDGRVTIADSIAAARSLLQPPTAVLTRPELCDVNGDGKCTIADATILRRTLLAPPTAVIMQACAPALAPAPILNVTQPVYGTFFAPGPGNQCNVSFAGNVPNVDDPDLSLFVGGVDTPTPGSAFNTVRVITKPLQSLLVQATRLSTGATKRVNEVVSCADSLGRSTPALSGLAIRLNDRGIDRLEPVLSDVVAQRVGDVGALIRALSPINVDRCLLDSTFGCVVNLRSVSISSAGLGRFGVALDSQTNQVALNATASNLFANYGADISNAPDCSGRVTATTVSLAGAFALLPLASNRRLIDVNLVSGPTVGTSGFSHTFTGGVCSVPGVSAFLEAIFDVTDTIRSEVVNAVEDELRDPDGVGSADSPLADAAESAFAGISLSTPGIFFDAPFASIIEDNVGVTFRIDANVNAALIDTSSPQPTSTLRIPSVFPSYGANSPNGQPYGLALSVDPSVLNKLLASELQAGRLKFDVTTLNFDLVNPGLGLGTRTMSTTLLGLILPDFAAVSPTENVRIQVRPSLAPAVLDPQNVPATEVVRAAGITVDFVGATTGKRFLRLAVDGDLNLNVNVAASAIDVTVTSVSNLQARLIEDNLGSVSQLTVDILMAIIAPLGNLRITQSLEKFPLPTVLGVGIVPIQIQNDFNGNFLNVFLDLQ